MTKRTEPGGTMLIVNARIHREPGDPAPAEALRIVDGLVAGVGSQADVGSAAAGERVVDLGGRAVLPAFIDSHTHFHRASILRELFLDFDALAPATLDDVLASVRDRALRQPQGTWIQGDSLSAARLAEGRWPDRHDLDTVAPDHHVVLRGIGKHVVAANSAALAAAGITRETPDPPGGRIERDADGEPTGVLHERAKLRLDQSATDTVVPQPDAADRRRALRAGIADLHRLGIATIHEMVRLPQEAADLAALHADGELGVRVRLYYRVHESPLSLESLLDLGVRRGLGDDRFRVLGVKVSVDGFCIFRNAAVYEPYAGEPDNCGLLRIEPEQLRDLVARANAGGLQVAVHAVGARAVDAALDAFEAAGAALAGPHRLEHGYVDVDRPRLDRMRRLGLVWSTQPAFLGEYAREWGSVFDAERRERLMPLRTGLDVGLPLLFNSDVPCASPDPLAAIRLAVDRSVDGSVTGGAEAVPLEAAWRAFTTTPADVAGDRALGRLVPGCRADLVVLDDDPFRDANALATLRVHATMIDGAFVHGEREVAE